jgi:hypothetical protein
MGHEGLYPVGYSAMRPPCHPFVFESRRVGAALSSVLNLSNSLIAIYHNGTAVLGGGHRLGAGQVD